MRYSVLVTLFVVLFCKLMQAEENSVSQNLAMDTWVGVYSSPSEIGGYSSTAMAIFKSLSSEDRLSYRMIFNTDVINVDSIDQDEYFGSVAVEGDKLFVPIADGKKYISDNKERILLNASIDTYTLVEINGKKVLMREDALKSYKNDNKLYDYGILIKVSDKASGLESIQESKHESIKILYRDKNKVWSDPFINGPNAR